MRRRRRNRKNRERACGKDRTVFDLIRQMIHRRSFMITEHCSVSEKENPAGSFCRQVIKKKIIILSVMF
jgi:hypothetical protein